MGVFSFGLTGGVLVMVMCANMYGCNHSCYGGMGCGLCGADRSPYFPSLLFLFLSALLFIFSLRPSVCPFSPLHAYVSRNTYYILLEKLIAGELGAMHAYMYCIWPNLHLLPIEMLRVRGKKIVVFDFDFQIFLILGRLIRLGRCRCRGWDRPQSGIITITVCVCVCACRTFLCPGRSYRLCRCRWQRWWSDHYCHLSFIIWGMTTVFHTFITPTFKTKITYVYVYVYLLILSLILFIRCPYGYYYLFGW